MAELDIESIRTSMERRERSDRWCSFCGKPEKEVYMLIAGPAIDLFICDECVQSAINIITQRKIENGCKAAMVANSPT